MFAYACPFCTQRLQAALERVGQRTICPKCLRPVTIPLPAGTVSEDHILHGGLDVDEGLEHTPISHITPSPEEAPVAPRTTPEPRSYYRPKSTNHVSPSTRRNEHDLAAEMALLVSDVLRLPPKPKAEPLPEPQLPISFLAGLSSLGLGLWAAGWVWRECWPYALIVAGWMIATGIAWIIARASQKGWKQVLLVLLPPVLLYRLGWPTRGTGHRPLAYVLAGLTLLSLVLLSDGRVNQPRSRSVPSAVASPNP